jgi:hypothetical protein
MSDINAGEVDPLAGLREALRRESGEGLALLDNPYDNPICSIGVDESIPCLTVSWKRYATSTQLRFILEHVIHMLEKHRVSRILGDDSAIPVIHAIDREWIARDWFPRALAAGWRASANRIPKNYFGQLTTSSVQSEAPAEVVIRSFTELSEARQWLRSFSVQT